MNTNEILNNLNADIVARFKYAIETGRWPNGEKITADQREICMQAVLVWEHHNTPETERTGYIDRGSKAKDESCGTHTHDHDHEFQPVQFKQ